MLKKVFNTTSSGSAPSADMARVKGQRRRCCGNVCCLGKRWVKHNSHQAGDWKSESKFWQLLKFDWARVLFSWNRFQEMSSSLGTNHLNGISSTDGRLHNIQERYVLFQDLQELKQAQATSFRIGATETLSCRFRFLLFNCFSVQLYFLDSRWQQIVRYKMWKSPSGFH